MKIQLWSKALLKSYPNLEMVAKQIDEKVNTLALSPPNARCGNTTEIVANKILKYVDKKIILCRTKVLIENILMKINSRYATVLKMKFVDELSYNDIANYFQVSVRTIRRYASEGIKYFSYHLEQEEYSPSKLAEIYKTEHWIGRIYLSFLKMYLKSQSKATYENFIDKTLKNKSTSSYEDIYDYDI